MTIPLLFEIFIKASVLLSLGLLIRSRVSKTRPQLRHGILMASAIGSLILPAVMQLPKLETKITIPQEILVSSPTQAVVGDAPAATGKVSDGLKITAQTDFPWNETMVVVWCTGLVVVMARYALGIGSLQMILQQKSQGFNSLPAELNTRHKIHPRLDLRLTNEPTIQSAMTWGVHRPVVLLPEDAISWSSQRLEMILLHEFAHLRRKDFVSQMLAELMCAIYWFNPLAWHCARAIREEAELAADEAVIAAGIRPTDYATELLEIAANLSMRNSMLTRVGISNMTQSKIESRLKAILSSNARRPQKGGAALPILAGLVLSGAGISAVASLKIQDPDQTPVAKQTQALIHAKQLTIASLIYAADYNDDFPYVKSTKEAEKVTTPYAKDKKIFKSPREGAEFRFNLNVAGVNMKSIEIPVVPLWYEVTPKGIDPAIGYCDGHAKILRPELVKEFQKALKTTFKRSKSMKPVSVGGGIGN